MNFPLHDLEPRDFEELCFWLIRASEIDELGHANVYGRSGQDQHGIDAYSYHHGRNEYRVYQCKRYQKYTPGDLCKAIAELEAGPNAPTGTPDWLRQATTFVLCISVPFANDKNLTDERDAQTKILKARKLEFVIWDASEISKRLQEQPVIVEEFFGIKGVEEYCPQTIGEPYLRGVKARAFLNIPRPNWNAKASVAPSALLKARNRIVSLEGRDTELKAYRAWTNDPNPWDVQLITGAGGTGKTRLMLEFCIELKAKGWNAGFMDANTKRTTDQDQWRDLLEQSRPVFAVVDYAEGRQEELIAFLKALQDGLGEREIPVRLMLLARGLGEWYDRLHEQDGAQDLLPTQDALNNPTNPKNRKLNPPSTLEQPEAAKAEFRRALEVFAPARGKTAPTRSIDLSSDLFKRVLFVHMAALLVVEGETLQNPTQAELLGAVLDVERKYWRSRMNKEQENLIPALERTMTLVTLGYPVQSLEAANALLDLDRNLSALDVNGKDPISNLLHDTYPGPAYINPIEPDLLAEHLIFTQLTRDQTGAKLIETAFGQAGPEPGELRVNPDQALGHLVRLAEWRPETLELWRAVFTGRLNNTWKKTNEPLLLTAMQIARETQLNGAKLGNMLAELLEAAPDRNLVIQAETPLLTYSVNLLNLAEVILRLRLAWVTHDERQYAECLGNHAGALENLGRFKEASSQAQAAEAILRQLWQRDPARYQLALARNLNNQCGVQHKLGDESSAFRSISEAVQLLRELNNSASLLQANALRPTLIATYDDHSVIEIEAKVTNLSPELATSLSNLSTCQSAVGNLNDALDTIIEAKKYLEALAFMNPDEFLPRLASCLLNESNRLREMGNLEGALEAIKKAVFIRQKLVRVKPDQSLPDLAMSWKNQSLHQRDVGNRYSALEAINEAVEIYLHLVERNPDIFTPALANSYGVQGGILMAVQKPFEALKSFAEGIRQLTPYLQRNPQKSVDLAQHLMHTYRTLTAKMLMREDAGLLRAVEEVIGSISTGDNQLQKVLENFEPFLQGMAAVALGNDESRAEIEEGLPRLEENGWKISDSVKRIWAGERDSSTLEAGLDSQDAALVHRILEIIQEHTP